MQQTWGQIVYVPLQVTVSLCSMQVWIGTALPYARSNQLQERGLNHCQWIQQDTGVQISKFPIFRPATKEGHNLFRDIRRDICGGRKIASRGGES